jgi:hypothetical protein
MIKSFQEDKPITKEYLIVLIQALSNQLMICSEKEQKEIAETILFASYLLKQTLLGYYTFPYWIIYSP